MRCGTIRNDARTDALNGSYHSGSGCGHPTPGGCLPADLRKACGRVKKEGPRSSDFEVCNLVLCVLVSFPVLDPPLPLCGSIAAAAGMGVDVDREKIRLKLTGN